MNIQVRPIPRIIYKLDVLSGQIVGYPSCGPGVDFLGSDPNVPKRPAAQHPFLAGTIDNPRYIMPAPIPPEKIGQGINFFEGTSSPKPASDVHRRDQAVFG